MDDVIVCPNCGETNPADMPYCHNCQWRLRPLDDAWATDQATDLISQSQPPSGDNLADDAVPAWLRSAPAQPGPEVAAAEAAAEQLRQQLAAQDARALPAGSSQRGESEDLLAGLAQVEQPDDEPIPDWVARVMGITESDESGQALPGDADPRSDFGEGRDPGSTRLSPGGSEPPGADGQLEASSTPAGGGLTQEGDEPVADATTGAHNRDSDGIYEWLRQLDANKAGPPVHTARPDIPATTDVPTWVRRMMGVQGEAAADPERSGPSRPDIPATTDVPTWVRRMMGVQGEPAADPERSDPSLPDWLQSTSLPAEDPWSLHLHSGGESASPSASAESSSASPQVEPPSDTAAAAALTTEDADALDVDAVFASMQMPPWATRSESAELPGATASSPAVRDDASIEPADLPSWVQAMRPLESTVAASGIQQPESQSESGGPLRGLGGVLPAIPGAAAPFSRPKPRAMNPDISDGHRGHTRLLEKMLEAESQPRSPQEAGRAGSPRALRWLIGAVLLLFLMMGLVSGSTNFVLPRSVPQESNAAIQVVEGLAPDAPVLAVFDYEPATAGEMEVAAASIMDHLLLLKHPRLALLSTSPTGSALAERFVSTTLRERAYVRGSQYVDLGYLSGGLSGVQFFARDPVAATPYGAATDKVWETQVLLGSTGLADFSAIIVLTDSLESGSVWIEQTTGHRGATPMLVVSSAQAGPMLLPYFDSGQIQGLVVGINGATSTEIANGGRPGLVRRYWDAYNMGLYTAAAFITLGALWQMASRWRRRQAEAA